MSATLRLQATQSAPPAKLPPQKKVLLETLDELKEMYTQGQISSEEHQHLRSHLLRKFAGLDIIYTKDPK